MMKKISPYPARLRHARHYIQVAESADNQYLSGGAGVVRGLALFDREYANLDVACAWLQTQVSAAEVDEMQIRAANATAHIGDLRYPKLDGRIPQIKVALVAARRLGKRAAQGTLLSNLGNVYFALGQARQALTCYQQALAITRERSDRSGEGSALGNLGNAYLAVGQARQALTCYEQALVIAREIGDRRDEGAVLDSLGGAYAALGDMRQAISHYQQALVIAREIGDQRREGAIFGNLGNAYAALGDVRQALSYYQQWLNIAQKIGDRRGESAALDSLGSAYLAAGEARRAIDFHQQALVIAQQTGDQRREGAIFGNLGNAYASLGDMRQALSCYQPALAVVIKLGDRKREGAALGNLGNAYASLGDMRQALSCYQQALAIAREIGDRSGEGSALSNLGIAFKNLGEARQAIPHYQQALAIVRQIGDRRGEGNVLGNLGNAYASLGDMRQALSCYQQALAITREIGDRQGEAETSWNYGQALMSAGDSAQALPLLELSLAFSQAIRHPLAATQAEIVAHIRQQDVMPDMKQHHAALASMPEAVRAAIRRRENAALAAALNALPAEEAAAISAQLRQMGIIGAGPDMARMQREFDPLLQEIVAAARGASGLRGATEEALARAEQGGWHIADAARRIWAGERDLAALTAGLDVHDSALIQRALDMLARPDASDAGPDSSLAGLPKTVRVALEQGDEAALQAAVTALPADERERVELTLQHLGDERFDALLRAIAAVAAGDERKKGQVEAALARLEQVGWMLREPSRRIWAGERDAGALAAGLDEQDHALVRRVLDLVGQYERSESPTQVGAGMPDPARLALAQQDAATFAMLSAAERERATARPAVLDSGGPSVAESSISMPHDRRLDRAREVPGRQSPAALQHALGTLPSTESAAIAEQLEQANSISLQRGPDLERVAQRLQPLLGDIALAAHGDVTAYALAEAALLRLRGSGWRLGEAAKRIWAGERDAEALTVGLDAQSATLVRRVLDLIASGPDLIFVAGAIQINYLRDQADATVRQVLATEDDIKRANLAVRLDRLAEQAQQQPGTPWLDLAAHLQALSSQLKECG